MTEGSCKVLSRCAWKKVVK